MKIFSELNNCCDSPLLKQVISQKKVGCYLQFVTLGQLSLMNLKIKTGDIFNPLKSLFITYCRLQLFQLAFLNITISHRRIIILFHIEN